MLSFEKLLTISIMKLEDFCTLTSTLGTLLSDILSKKDISLKEKKLPHVELPFGWYPTLQKTSKKLKKILEFVLNQIYRAKKF